MDFYTRYVSIADLDVFDGFNKIEAFSFITSHNAFLLRSTVWISNFN